MGQKLCWDRWKNIISGKIDSNSLDMPPLWYHISDYFLNIFPDNKEFWFWKDSHRKILVFIINFRTQLRFLALHKFTSLKVVIFCSFWNFISCTEIDYNNQFFSVNSFLWLYSLISNSWWKGMICDGKVLIRSFRIQNSEINF